MYNFRNKSIYNNYISNSNELTLDDLNKYLPALQKIDDMLVNIHKMNEGVFYGLCQDGLEKIPDSSIDLIIAEPPDSPIKNLNNKVKKFTINEYLEWNQKWINECFRILNNTGSIYIICDWKNSGMYQSLLNQKFNIQTRISWKNKTKKLARESVLIDYLSDIWFASKSDNYFINQNKDGELTNIWSDIINYQPGRCKRYPRELIKRIVEISSSKLNWVLDPFCRLGDIGAIVSKSGRRFIGFEANKDKLLLSMKKIDRK